MSKLYINSTLEKSIRSYCDLNNIEDVNAFANRCTMQGFNIIKYGISPKDNMERENNGIKDVKKNGKKSHREDEREQKNERQELSEGRKEKEEIESTEERKGNITVRQIRVIKK